MDQSCVLIVLEDLDCLITEECLSGFKGRPKFSWKAKMVVTVPVVVDGKDKISGGSLRDGLSLEVKS